MPPAPRGEDTEAPRAVAPAGEIDPVSDKGEGSWKGQQERKADHSVQEQGLARLFSTSMNSKQPPQPAFTQAEAIVSATTLRERMASGLLKDLQPHPHWIVWQRQGEQKVPYQPTACSQASSTKPQTWGTLQEALRALTTGRFAGLGFMLDPRRLPLTFIDLDHCMGPRQKTITDITNPNVLALVRAIRSYTEISPSGDGLHILAYGDLPGSGIHRAIEMYTRGRYFTVTGHHVSGTPCTIEHRQEQITRLYQAQTPKARRAIPPPVFLPQRQATHLSQLPPQAAGDPVLQALLRGDLSGYGGDASRGDFVLLMKLLHWTGDDVALTKQVYLASPLGQRVKHGRRKAVDKRGPTTYVQMTISNILRKRSNQPRKR